MDQENFSEEEMIYPEGQEPEVKQDTSKVTHRTLYLIGGFSALSIIIIGVVLVYKFVIQNTDSQPTATEEVLVEEVATEEVLTPEEKMDFLEQVAERSQDSSTTSPTTEEKMDFLEQVSKASQDTSTTSPTQEEKMDFLKTLKTN